MYRVVAASVQQVCLAGLLITLLALPSDAADLTLRIESDPSGAEVLLIGGSAGRTPLTVDERAIYPNNYPNDSAQLYGTVTLRHEGCKTLVHRVTGSDLERSLQIALDCDTQAVASVSAIQPELPSILTAPAPIAIAVAPINTYAGDQKMIEEILVIITSDSLQTQGMAMILSNTMAQQGAKVNILLCDKAGDMALKSYQAPALKPKDVTPGQMLRGLLKQGGVANVCALYLPNSDYSKNNLIEGVGVATPLEMADQMLNPALRTFTF